MQNEQTVFEMLMGAGEIYGRSLTRVGAQIMLEELKAFPESDVKKSISKCVRELRTFPTVADIVARIADGRPGPEEAWAMLPKDEYGSVVWTSEMAYAFGVCRHLLESDNVAARMAFLEKYRALVAQNRSSGVKPEWSPSFGLDKSMRAAALRDAVEMGRITQDQALTTMPELENYVGQYKFLEDRTKKMAELVSKEIP